MFLEPHHTTSRLKQITGKPSTISTALQLTRWRLHILSLFLFPLHCLQRFLGQWLDPHSSDKLSRSQRITLAIARCWIKWNQTSTVTAAPTSYLPILRKILLKTSISTLSPSLSTKIKYDSIKTPPLRQFLCTILYRWEMLRSMAMVNQVTSEDTKLPALLVEPCLRWGMIHTSLTGSELYRGKILWQVSKRVTVWISMESTTTKPLPRAHPNILQP